MLQQMARAVMNFEGHEPGPVPGSRKSSGRSSRGVPSPPSERDVMCYEPPSPTGTSCSLSTWHPSSCTGVDVLVSSENIYFEMSKTFRRTVSGSLRRAAATKDTVGRITDDVIARQLADWVRRFGVPGLPVAAGTVAVTSPGALSAQGVRRILHAAVATPSATGDGRRVRDRARGRRGETVRRVFQLAAAPERGEVRVRVGDDSGDPGCQCEYLGRQSWTS